jgi:dolichol-phosphate mannosyltransferase
MPEPPQLPKIADAPMSVILTAHDSRARLNDLLEKWSKHLEKLEREVEILLIDDSGPDLATARADALLRDYPRLRLLRHEGHLGLGAALRTGLAEARFPLLCTCTCDPGYQPADLKGLLEFIDSCHLVCGYRLDQGNPKRQIRPPWWSRTRDRFLFGVHVRDAECSLRLYRRDIFARIPIQSDGPFALVEILAKANFLGCVIGEVPVGYRPQPGAETGARWKETRKDARRVFRNPDFGPAVLSAAPVQPEPQPAPDAVPPT